MLWSYVVTLFLLAVSVESSSTSSSPSDDDPLETSETGHFRRRRLWRKLLGHLHGLGGGGGYGHTGLNILTELSQFQKHHHQPHLQGHLLQPSPQFGGVYGTGSHYLGQPLGLYGASSAGIYAANYGSYGGLPSNYLSSKTGIGLVDHGIWHHPFGGHEGFGDFGELELDDLLL